MRNNDKGHTGIRRQGIQERLVCGKTSSRAANADNELRLYFSYELLQVSKKKFIHFPLSETALPVFFTLFATAVDPLSIGISSIPSSLKTNLWTSLS